MGNGCTKLSSVYVKKNNDLNKNMAIENLDHLNNNLNDVTDNLIDVTNKLNKLETTVIYLKDKLDKEFPKKETIPVCESFDVYKVNNKKVTIPSYYSAEKKLEIINEYKLKFHYNYQYNFQH